MSPNGALAQLGERFAGSEEVRSSILLGSTKFLDIFGIILSGLSGSRPPLSGPVPLCEEVLGSNPVTNLQRKYPLK